MGQQNLHCIVSSSFDRMWIVVFRNSSGGGDSASDSGSRSISIVIAVYVLGSDIIQTLQTHGLSCSSRCFHSVCIRGIAVLLAGMCAFMCDYSVVRVLRAIINNDRRVVWAVFETRMVVHIFCCSQYVLLLLQLLLYHYHYALLTIQQYNFFVNIVWHYLATVRDHTRAMISIDCRTLDRSSRDQMIDVQEPDLNRNGNTSKNLERGTELRIDRRQRRK